MIDGDGHDLTHKSKVCYAFCGIHKWGTVV